MAFKRARRGERFPNQFEGFHDVVFSNVIGESTDVNVGIERGKKVGRASPRKGKPTQAGNREILGGEGE